MRTTIVIPTYNEIKNIEKLIFRIRQLYPFCKVLVVDSASPDGTGELLDKLTKNSDKVQILHRYEKDGLGKAYIAGFKYILSTDEKCQRIIQMDADFSHNPIYIKKLLEVTEKKDVAIGSRYALGSKIINRNFRRKLLTFISNVVVHFWLRPNIKDCTGGFRCFKRKVIENIEFDSIKTKGYLFQIAMLKKILSLGYSIAEVPIVFKGRERGKSKLGMAAVGKAFLEMCRLMINK